MGQWRIKPNNQKLQRNNIVEIKTLLGAKKEKYYYNDNKK